MTRQGQELQEDYFLSDSVHTKLVPSQAAAGLSILNLIVSNVAPR